MSDDSALPLSRTGNPAGVADSFAIRPDMYAGSPVAFARAAAFIEGIGWAQAVGTGRPSPNRKFHELLHLPSSCEAKAEDQEYEAIQTLFPALNALFTAAAAHIPLKGPLPRRPGTTLTKDMTLRWSRTPSPRRMHSPRELSLRARHDPASGPRAHLQRAGLPPGIGMTHTCPKSLVTTSAEGKSWSL